MADFSSVFFSTITEIDANLRAKEFSAVELTRAFCDRMEKLGPRYNALALSLRKEAVKQSARGRRRVKTRSHSRAIARHSLRRQGSAGRQRQADHLGRAAV